MSKIERLNARVAKLLTVAVHEVLEVVRETVTEYQEKTARTQRENESLKRRLQELKDKEERRNTVQEQLAVAEGVPVEQKQEWNPSLKHDAQIVFVKRKEVTEQLKMRQGEEEASVLKSDLITEPPFDCDAMVTGHGTVECADFSPTANAVLSGFTSHPGISSTDLDSAHAVNISSSPCPNTSSVGILSNSDEIKSEPDSVEYTSSQHACQNDYYVCPDAENNMAHPDTVPELEQVSRGSDELACFQSNHNPFVDRFAFAKNRSFVDNRKQKQYFRREDPHRCVLCGKTFTRVGNLRIHQRCHTGEKPYSCAQCGRHFSHAGNLKKHKRVHTGERPYCCYQCGKTFSQSSHLKKHQKIHVDRHLGVA